MIRRFKELYDAEDSAHTLNNFEAKPDLLSERTVTGGRYTNAQWVLNASVAVKALPDSNRTVFVNV